MSLLEILARRLLLGVGTLLFVSALVFLALRFYLAMLPMPYWDKGQHLNLLSRFGIG